MRRQRPTTHDLLVEAVARSMPDPDAPDPHVAGEASKRLKRATGLAATQYASCEFLADELDRQAEIVGSTDGTVSVVVDDDDSLVVHVGNAIQQIKDQDS